MCPSQTPLHSPAQVFLNNSKEASQPPPFSVEPGTSSDENELCGRNKEQHKCPSRRESSSDSSLSGEDDSASAPAKKPHVSSPSALNQALNNMLSQAHSQQEEPTCAMFYLPRKTPSKPAFENRYCQGCMVSRAPGSVATAAGIRIVPRT